MLSGRKLVYDTETISKLSSCTELRLQEVPPSFAKLVEVLRAFRREIIGSRTKEQIRFRASVKSILTKRKKRRRGERKERKERKERRKKEKERRGKREGGRKRNPPVAQLPPELTEQAVH